MSRFLSVLLLFSVACHDRTQPTARKYAARGMQQAKMAPATALAASVVADGAASDPVDAVADQPTDVRAEPESMLIRTGTASIQVDSLDVGIARVRSIAAQAGGYIANSAIETGADQVRSATLEIKTPATAFDRVVSGLSPVGKLESVTVTAQDVGEEYVDVQARIANGHRLEDRLIALLATRTGKLKDVLDVERELARVREEIERHDGRLRYLRAHTALSTLTVTVHEPPPVLVDRPGDHPLADAARQAWRNFVALVAACIASLGVLIPVAAIAAVIWRIARRLHGINAKQSGAAGV